MGEVRPQHTVRPTQRWLWLVVAVAIGGAAWLMLGVLRDREDRARAAEAKASQVAADLQSSLQLGLALWRRPRPAGGESPLDKVIAVQTEVVTRHIDELAELLPGSAGVAELRGLTDDAERGLRAPDMASRVAQLSALGGSIIEIAGRIEDEQRERREAARRQTLAGSALVLLLALVTLVAFAAHAQRRLAAASRRHAEQLERMAGEDTLTGLANRRTLDGDLRTLPAGGPVQLALWDLDGFKAFNDEHGHAAGDALLADFAHALRGALGDAGRAYRLGGDEFCVVSAQGADVAARLDGLAAASLAGGVTATYGLATWPADAPDPEAALHVADERMYAAKRARYAGRPGPDALAS